MVTWAQSDRLSQGAHQHTASGKDPRNGGFWLCQYAYRYRVRYRFGTFDGTLQGQMGRLAGYGLYYDRSRHSQYHLPVPGSGLCLLGVQPAHGVL